MAKTTKKVEIPNMVVHSKIKDFVKTITPDTRMSGEFLAELNEQLAQMINNGIRRCHENGRKTLKPSDL